MRWPFRWPRLAQMVGGAAQTTDRDDLRQQLAARIDIGAGLSNRNQATRYPALARATTLIASITGMMICSGGLSVVARDGKKLDDARTRNIIDVVSWSPDDRITPALSFIEDVLADYCLEGNALVTARFVGTRLVQLTRHQPWDAYTVWAANRPHYWMRPADQFETAAFESYPARAVAHIRWPKLLRYGLSSSARHLFATAPIVAMRNDLNIALAQLTRIEEWFESAGRPGVHFDIQEPHDTAYRMTKEQRLEAADAILTAHNSARPTVTFNTTSSILDTAAQDRSSKELRDMQREVIAGFYGIPLPLMSVPIGQWSKGINEEVLKFAWRVCFRTHMERFLRPLELLLLRPGERFAVDTAELVRGNAEGIAELTRALQGDAQRHPIATREEMRHIAGLSRDPEGEFMDPLPAGPVGGAGPREE